MKTQEQKINDLLEKWIVVDFRDEQEDRVRVTKRANFETLNFCDCYGNYGNKVGCYDAGCYSLDNSDSGAEADLKEAICKEFKISGQFNIESVISDFEFTFCNEDDEETYSNLNIEEVNAFIRKWRAENESHTQVKGNRSILQPKPQKRLI